MRRFFGNVRFATTLAFGAIVFVTGAVAGATGGTFILGISNAASSQTGLAATTSGNGLFVQNSGAGNGGVFVSNAATGIAGVTRQASRFALAGTNDGTAFHPAGGAVSASGKQNHGLNASTQNIAADAVRGVHGSSTGTASETAFANGVYGETRYGYGNGVMGVANTTSGEAWGAWGHSGSADGIGTVGSNDGGGLAGAFFGDVYVDGDVMAWSFTTMGTASMLTISEQDGLIPGDPVAIAGSATSPAGGYVLTVRRAAPDDEVIGIVGSAVQLAESTRQPGSWFIARLERPAVAGDGVLVVTSGLVTVPASAGLGIGQVAAVDASGGLEAVAPSNVGPGRAVGRVVGVTEDGRSLLFVDPR